jgi:hypothetical protein
VHGIVDVGVLIAGARRTLPRTGFIAPFQIVFPITVRQIILVRETFIFGKFAGHIGAQGQVRFKLFRRQTESNLSTDTYTDTDTDTDTHADTDADTHMHARIEM